MMKLLDDNLLLLGLVVNTIPFLYKDSALTASINIHIETDQLKQIRENLYSTLNNSQDLTDDNRHDYLDSISFLDKMISNLEATK